MGRKLLGVAAAVLIGVAAVSASAVAQGTGADGSRPGLRSEETGSSGGPTADQGNRSGVGVPEPVGPRSGAVVSPSLGDVNRGMSGYYRNRVGTTPPSAQGGGWRGGGRSGGGRSGGGSSGGGRW